MAEIAADRNRGRNNNPEGHNQYSGLMGTARENPIAAAAAVGGAVAAGVFCGRAATRSAIRSATFRTRSANGAKGFSRTASSAATTRR